jgi:hypothetical protein
MGVRQRMEEIGEYEAIKEVIAFGKPLDSDAARIVAGWWHGGMWSGLYSFSSSGHVSARALSETYADIAKCEKNDQTSDIPALCALAEHLRVALGPVTDDDEDADADL